MPPETDTSDLSIDGAANAFERLLSGKPEKRERRATEPQSPSEDAAPEGDQPEDEAPEDNPDADQSDDEGHEPEPEGEESDEGSEGDEPEGDEDEQAQTFTVKVDGKEQKVPLKELVAGYSRQADYSRKTAALAEERRSFGQEQEAVRSERGQYAQLLPVLAQQLTASLPQPPDRSLMDADPLGYMVQMENYREHLAIVQATQGEAQRLAQMQEAEHARSLHAMVKQGTEKLPDLVPAWKDRRTMEREVPQLRGYLKQVGYSDEEINQAYDPRAVAAAYKAMKYDQLTSRRPKADPPPLERNVRQPAAPEREQPRPQKRLSQAKDRLRKTGHIDDAAAAFGALLGKG